MNEIKKKINNKIKDIWVELIYTFILIVFYALTIYAIFMDN